MDNFSLPENADEIIEAAKGLDIKAGVFWHELSVQDVLDATEHFSEVFIDGDCHSIILAV